MLLLAVDTTTTNGSVALAEGEDVFAEVRLGRQVSYSSTLLASIEFLLSACDRQAREVDVWAVAVGPGGFTGLRVGISTIQGLALAGGRRCVGVSALQAWALGAAGSAPAIVTLLDAMRGEVYEQVFDGEAEPKGAPRVGRLEELAGQAPAGAAFVGDVVAGARRAIEAACPGARFPPCRPFLAARVAALAIRAAAAGCTDAPETLRPLYLREAALRRSLQA